MLLICAILVQERVLLSFSCGSRQVGRIEGKWARPIYSLMKPLRLILSFIWEAVLERILISYLAELANSSLVACTAHMSYKHPESTTLTIHSSTTSAFKMNENQNSVAWFQDYKNEGWKRPARACVLAPMYLWNMVSCVIYLGILVQLDFKCPKWQTPPLILKINLENNKSHF